MLDRFLILKIEEIRPKIFKDNFIRNFLLKQNKYVEFVFGSGFTKKIKDKINESCKTNINQQS